MDQNRGLAGDEAVDDVSRDGHSPDNIDDHTNDQSNEDVESQEEPPSGPHTVKIVAVKRRADYPPLHYDAGDVEVSDGEWVVVPTDHGFEVGRIYGRAVPITFPETAQIPKVARLASTHEIEQYYHNLEREKFAWETCEKEIVELNLSMKLVQVESFFDGSKIIFYYVAEQRVDFRELVKNLVRSLRTRIEMRQIGVRHEAKMLGGIGCCGRELCCATFLKSFDPISIKMAKAQNLPLNPSKISGLCGRLLCCLTHEYNTYLDLKQELPSMGRSCDTPAGEGKVIGQNVIMGTVTVAVSDGSRHEFSAAELSDYHVNEKEDAIDPDSLESDSDIPASHEEAYWTPSGDVDTGDSHAEEPEGETAHESVSQTSPADTDGNNTGRKKRHRNKKRRSLSGDSRSKNTRKSRNTNKRDSKPNKRSKSMRRKFSDKGEQTKGK